MKKAYIFWIKILVGLIIGVSCYFIASAFKSPVKIEETEAKYMSRLIEAPKDGSLPTEHDAKDVIAYALWNASNLDYKIKTTGQTKASIATQNISIDRVKIGKKAMVSTVSSGFITVAGQKLYADNKVLMRDCIKIEGSTATWSNDAPECISYKEMIRRVGWLPFQANGYIISLDTFLNPDEIKVEKIENDLYKIAFDLNPAPDYAPFWYRREIVYDANSTMLPNFKSIHMEFRIDKDYRIIYQNTKEVYTIQTYGIKAETTTTLEDHFTYDNVLFDEEALAYFSQYENVEPKDPDDSIIKEDVASILISSLQNGVNDVLFDVDAKIDNLNIKGNASLNIYDLSNIKFKFKLEDLFSLEYLNSSIYFDGLGFKLKGTNNDLNTILGKLNKNDKNIIDANELLKSINNAKLVENGNNKQIDTTINLYGILINLSANLDKIDNGYILNYININTNILQNDLSLSIKKGNTKIEDKDYSDYQKLSDLMPIITRAIDYLDKKNFEFDIETKIYNSLNQIININGNLKLKLYENNEFDTELNLILKQTGKDDYNLNIKIISDEYFKQNNIDSNAMIYISYGYANDDSNQLRVKMPLADGYSILNTILKTFGLKLNVFEKYSNFNFNDIDLYQIRNLINIDLSDVSNINIKDLVKDFEIKDHILNMKLNLNNNLNELVKVSLDANNVNNVLTKFSLENLIIKKYNDNIKLDLNLNSLNCEQAVIIPDNKEYVLINEIDDLINGFVATSTLKDFEIKGDINLDFTLFGTTFKNLIGLDFKTTVDEQRKPTIHMSLNLEKLDSTFKSLVTTSYLDIYYKNNYVYIKKISNSDTYELKVESSKFLKNIKYYFVEFGLGVPQTILNLFKNSSSDSKYDFSKIINEYNYSKDKYIVKIDMGSLLKNNNYNLLEFVLCLNNYKLNENKDNVKILSGIENLSFSILNLINIKINDLKLVNVNEGKIIEVSMIELNEYINNYNKEIDVIYKNGEISN